MANQVDGVEFSVTVDNSGVTAANSQIIKSNDAVERSFGEIDSATSSTGAGFSKLGDNVDQLGQKMTSASSALANVIARQISLGNTITENNTVIDKNGNELTTATAALAKYAAQAQSSSDKIDAVNAAMGRMVKSTHANSSAMQNLKRNSGQVGIQIQQLVGQIQGGQNAFQAISAQAADLGIVLGAAGLGVGVALAASAIGFLTSVMSDNEESADDLIEKIKDLNKEYELTAAQAAFLAQETAKETAQNEKSASKIKKRISEIEGLISSQESMSESIKTGSEQMGRRAARQSQLESSSKTLREELVKLKAELSLLNDEKGEKKDDSAERARVSAEQRVAAIKSGLEIETQLLHDHYRTRTELELGQITEAEAARQMAQDRQIASMQAASNNKINQIKAEIIKVKELEFDSEAERSELINELRMAELTAISNFEAQKSAIEKDAADARLAVAESEAKAKRQIISDSLTNISALMNTESRKAFEIGKVAAIASATITGYDAAVTNFKKGSEIGGPLVGAAYAASSLLSTGAYISQIANTSFGSTSSSTATSTTSTTATTATASTSSESVSRTIDIAGYSSGSLYTLSGEELVNLLNEAVGDGYVINT